MNKSAFPQQERRAHVVSDFPAELARLRGQGWRVDEIYPADNPATAILSRDGDSLRLSSAPEAEVPSAVLPDFRPEIVLTRSAADGGEGRAGMRYRDLIPGRLGGRYIASHITIPKGGPVDDWVHFHAVAFQMIFVAKGWVRVVYEDQGDPFVMEAGDLVLQPPYIRHRVLESSSGLEVVEVGCPALHRTFADHDIALPNDSKEKHRFFGQRFLRHICSQSPWTYFGGGEAQETGMSEATQGLADVRVMRGGPFDFQRHEGELVFGFVLSGSAQLGLRDGFELGPADAFVVPPAEPWGITGNSVDFRMLLVSTGTMPAQIPGEST